MKSDIYKAIKAGDKGLLNMVQSEEGRKVVKENFGYTHMPDGSQITKHCYNSKITSDTNLKPEDKEQALKLLELDIMEMQNISSRWSNDMKSDSWLSKNTRPLSLIYLTFASTILMVVDSFHTTFDVDIAWVELLKTLLITVYVAYFGSRGAEKIQNIRK